MKMWLRSALLVMVATTVVTSPGEAQVPDGTPVYTRIANWQIARPNWDAYAADLEKNQLPLMEKLLADGVITEYGVASNVVHTPDGYTHTTWFSSKTLAQLEKALGELVASEAKLPDADRRRSNTDFAGTKHSDTLVRSRIIGGRTAKFTNGYMLVSLDQVQPGKGQAYTEWFDKSIRPVLEPLAANGAVNSFGVDTEFVHTGDPGLRVEWIIVPSADGLDKVDSAFSAANRARTAAERDAMGQMLRETLVSGAHRDELWQISAYASKY